MREGVAARLEGSRTSEDRSLADHAYERILSMIMDGTISVSGKLPTEHVLSKQFHMSRPVVRQALKQLREDNVIVSRQGSGSYVKRRPDDAILNFAPVGSIADIQRTFEFRAAIEGEAAFLAAKRWSEADMRQLKASLDELDRCVREGELGVEADATFHAVVCAASGNQYFVAAHVSMKQNIITGMNLTRNLSLTKPQERLALVQREHSAIFEAIAERNQQAARDAMRMHVENARKRVFEGAI